LTGSDYPDVAELVPQRGRMRLLSGVVSHSIEETVCAIDLERSGLFAESDGSIPAFVALEYMAQCAAAHAGLANRSGSEPPRANFLLGTRRLQLAIERFRPGQRLLVSARHHRGESGLVIFDCVLSDADSDETLAEGRLNLYTVAHDIPLGESPA
jgi:predicted hotdog family 3-hydroxylacyl-ACP dehydratase